MSSIRVGIVGAGTNTRERHIPNLQAIDGVELVSVGNRSRESSEAVAREFGIPVVHDHWTEVVADEGIDAVVIGTWPNMHMPVTLAALEHEKHVLCEARLAMNAAEAHRMREAARARPHLVAQVVPPPLTLRVEATVRRMIDEGFTGRLVAVDARIGGGFLNLETPFMWRHDFDRSGYNTMFMGVLYECVMRWAGHATSVVAMSRTFVPDRRDADGTLHPVRVPDHLDVIAQMSSGAQCHLQVSEVTGMRSGAEIWLFGSEGTIRFAGGELFAGRPGDDELQPVEIPSAEEGGWRVEEEFVGAIRGEEEVRRSTFEDGVKYMEFTEAVARSAASGSRVAVPL
jgi:predicted dehydrogenase